jgi:enoyl-CoA hydratase/carnithine racemase
MTDTIRYDRGADGIVTLTLDDPTQSANTMNRAYVASMSGALDRLETLGPPVVAAVNGSALGGGLEITLACHHRIALDAPGSRLGLPEVTLGLLPGAGGVTRTVRMLGLAAALTTVLLTGRQMRPADALAAGIVDEVVATPAELLERARAWIAANPRPTQPWDRPDYRMPGGSPASRSLAAQLPAFPATLRKQLKGARLPAPEAILATAVEGAQVDLETALTVETRNLVGLLTGQVAKNMIGAFFLDLKAVNGGAARPAEVDAPPVLDRITTTDQVDALAGCDAVIEAVFEDPALKKAVFAEVLPVLAPDALLASNTSTLPITGLAEGVDRPAFPAWTGGVIRYVRQYAGGPAGFAARATELAYRYGDRFTPPGDLVDRLAARPAEPVGVA